MSETKLSVIIPAYNEEERLPRTLLAIDAYLQKQNYGYEIVVVSDGSTDNTVRIAENMKVDIQGLRVIELRPNRGKGYAVRKGMLNARGDYRIFMDADNATSVDHVEKMWPIFERNISVVIGSRDVEESVITVAQPAWRVQLGDLFNLVIQVLVGLVGIWDTQCGFKGFTAKGAQVIFSKTVIDRWVFDVELLVIAKACHYKIAEIPVVWRNDAQSKVKFSLTIIVEVLQIMINKFNGKYKISS